jgi:hypothetical protein
MASGWRRRRKALGRSPCRARLLRRCRSWVCGSVASKAVRTAVSEGAPDRAPQAAASEVRRAAASNRGVSKVRALHLGPWSLRRKCCWHSWAACA